MKQNILFRGILPALVSPVSEDGEVLVRETERLVKWQMSEGVNGFYICGLDRGGAAFEKGRREKSC